MKCTNCGAPATDEQAQLGQCHYCGVALRRATSPANTQAAVQLLEDRDGDGVPDGLEALAKLQAAQQKLRDQQEAEAFRQSEIQQLKMLRQKVSSAAADWR